MTIVLPPDISKTASSICISNYAKAVGIPKMTPVLIEISTHSLKMGTRLKVPAR